MTWNGGLFNAAVCEWCGHVEVLQDDSIQINFCASCRRQTMRSSCPGCRAPIQPGKNFCIQCGSEFMVTGEKPPSNNGWLFGPPVPTTIYEPTAEERAKLSEGGKHWKDVEKKEDSSTWAWAGMPLIVHGVDRDVEDDA